MKPKPLVLVLVGSDSDLPALAGCFATLSDLGIPHEVHVASAHRTPEKVRALVTAAAGKGVRVVIAAAGGAAHLAGVCAAHTVLPVIGIPLAAGALGGVDALYSTANMPPGIPVATVSVGPWGATNAAILAGQILGLSSPAIAGKVLELRRAAAAKIEEKDRRLQVEGASAIIASQTRR